MNTELYKRYDMLPPGSRVLCAVSGGADSMCLLHWLLSRREALAIEVCAAHFEHGLRGEESLRDMAFVEAICREWGVPCITERGDTPGFAATKRLGIEEAARLLRYEFLERAARKLGCRCIATAHNADDNAETILLNLARGSGTRGLAGIPPVRGRIIRPLLDVTRAEIETYLRENAVPHVEDGSNAEEVFARNRLRRQVLPLLRELNPELSAAMGRTAELLRQDEDYLRQQAGEFILRNWESDSLPAAALAALHPALASRVIRGLCPAGLSLAHVEAALAFAGGGSEPGFLDLPGIRLRRERGRLYFGAGEPIRPLPPRVLRPGTVTEIPEAGLRIRTELARMTGPVVHNEFKTYCLKYENIKGDIVCSSRRPGDRLTVAGRGVTKSLKSLFLEAGLTQRQRELTPVFRDELGVLAVHGLAVAERCEAAEGETVLRLIIEQTETI